MRKLIILIFVGFVLLTLVKLGNIETTVSNDDIDEVRGVYISYIELQKYLDNKDEKEQKSAIDKMVENVKNDKFHWIILHVRSFSDSLYPSEVFPTNYLVTGNDNIEIKFDILAYFIEKAHDAGIEIHAWINPFRVRNQATPNSISIKNPAFKWFGTSNVKVIETKGIFYNPASEDVQKLILSGIREILENYDVDGIHFDDYFYPDGEIDLENYGDYIATGGTLSLSNYRLKIINDFVKKVYSLVHEIRQDVVFGIAPEGNVENNYEKNYADVDAWLKEEGYVDYIMPQIYYGFQNSKKPYAEVLNDWNDKIINKDIDLIPALAFYKTGEFDEYAGSGNMEWQNFYNIIQNQIIFAREMSNYKGFSLFRYGNLYETKGEIRAKEYQNFLETIKF